ncbi:unnamed protein product [Absidia cylindrospora]
MEYTGDSHIRGLEWLLLSKGMTILLLLSKLSIYVYKLELDEFMKNDALIPLLLNFKNHILDLVMVATRSRKRKRQFGKTIRTTVSLLRLAVVVICHQSFPFPILL